MPYPASDKLKIAVDLDGVLAETMVAWCEKANEELGTRLTIQDLDSWASWKKVGISREEFFRILDETWETWEDIPPTEPNIARKVAKIGRFGDVDVVTGRSKRTVEAARNWLASQKIGFRRFVRVLGWRDKVFLNYDVYIDDAPELMPLVSRGGLAWGILYDRPWNRDVASMARVVRAENWDKIPSLVKKIQEGRA